MARIGVLIVGVNGVNGATLLAGSTLMRLGVIDAEYGITSSAEFAEADLISVDEMVFGGWDYFSEDARDIVRKSGAIPAELLTLLGPILPSIAFPGMRTELDIPKEPGFDTIVRPTSPDEAIDEISRNIESFRRATGVGRVIVLYGGSPARRVHPALKILTESEVRSQNVDILPSALLYAIAALETGCPFADLTPSETLEFRAIAEVASNGRAQFAGRDLSTGETFMKHTLAKMFALRNLRVSSWYSLNIIGNHDGQVLSMPEHASTKIDDKIQGLYELLGYDDFDHQVRIDYFPPRGDRKESWDVIDFFGWLGAPMSLRVNWHGQDAALAAPMILDIIRILNWGADRGRSGLQDHLGIFFKRPFGTSVRSPEAQLNSLMRVLLEES